MMKRSQILNYSLFFSLLFFHSIADSEEKKEADISNLSIHTEIAVLEELISSTKSTLAAQERLLKLILSYQETRQQFCEDSENRKLAGKLVRSAYQISELLKENHLAHLFPKNFLEEIDFFARLKNNSPSA